MSLEEITMALFARATASAVVAYIHRFSRRSLTKTGRPRSLSQRGSCSWSRMFQRLLTPSSTAPISGLAACFAVNALCCVAILAVAYWKRREHARQCHCPSEPALSTV